jgi:hypothetical protein
MDSFVTALIQAATVCQLTSGIKGVYVNFDEILINLQTLGQQYLDSHRNEIQGLRVVAMALINFKSWNSGVAQIVNEANMTILSRYNEGHFEHPESLEVMIIYWIHRLQALESRVCLIGTDVRELYRNNEPTWADIVEEDSKMQVKDAVKDLKESVASISKTIKNQKANKPTQSTSDAFYKLFVDDETVKVIVLDGHMVNVEKVMSHWKKKNNFDAWRKEWPKDKSDIIAYLTKAGII